MVYAPWCAMALGGSPPETINTMKPNLYAIISRVVLDGIDQGFRNTRAIIPDKDASNLTENIHMSVMRELSEYFTFKEDERK